jgi:hydrogenase expression/formation protein HypD
MKYVDEYRDEAAVRRVLDDIRLSVTRPWTIMEVCGGQTHNLVRFGIDELLPKEVELVHGPGCPVCVTPLELIDKALMLAARPDVIFASYGDMLRVPGSREDLFAVKARGGQIKIVYSPLDAIKLAKQNPDKTVVFFAIGFETTAPANAMALVQARQIGQKNFCVLVSHVTVPPAITAILSSPTHRVQGFLAAGHVCTVMGTWEYEPLARRFSTPIVVTGFEPLDLAQGIRECILQLEAGKHEVVNAYARSVRREGNRPAMDIINRVFEPCDRAWRGIGVIPMSGYRLREEFADMDAERRFPEVQAINVHENPICISGQVLQGLKKPHECPAFGKQCSPQHPLGATMVSSEGACAAYYRFRFQISNLKSQSEAPA